MQKSPEPNISSLGPFNIQCKSINSYFFPGITEEDFLPRRGGGGGGGSRGFDDGFDSDVGELSRRSERRRGGSSRGGRRHGGGGGGGGRRRRKGGLRDEDRFEDEFSDLGKQKKMRTCKHISVWFGFSKNTSLFFLVVIVLLP